jgi:hypothetical protein
MNERTKQRLDKVWEMLLTLTAMIISIIIIIGLVNWLYPPTVSLQDMCAATLQRNETLLHAGCSTYNCSASSYAVPIEVRCIP